MTAATANVSPVTSGTKTIGPTRDNDSASWATLADRNAMNNPDEVANSPSNGGSSAR